MIAALKNVTELNSIEGNTAVQWLTWSSHGNKVLSFLCGVTLLGLPPTVQRHVLTGYLVNLKRCECDGVELFVSTCQPAIIW